MKKIYLDYAATTPLDPEVIKVMNLGMKKYFGNPSSVHSFGQEARKVLEDGRKTVAFYLDCESDEVIFTSGGSESDNLAICGLIEALPKAGHLPHIITSEFEHHAVLDTVRELVKNGQAEATFIKPTGSGLITPESIKMAVKKNTVLVSIIYVNNEIGTVQPIREIGKLIEVENKKRSKDQKIYFHTDAVQAAEFFELGVRYLHVDLLTFTAHKIYGPKGTGVLFVKRGTPIRRQIIGGAQEFRKRAGTENVIGVLGLSRALGRIIEEKADKRSGRQNKLLSELSETKETCRLRTLRDHLIDEILKIIPKSRLNGDRFRRSPANANISFENAEGESILLNLDLLGIAASSGSACTSGSLLPSHVLLSIGLPPEIAHGSIRFTLGRQTTVADIDYLIEVLPKIVSKVRKMSPFNED
jgi:cysteine desulfurase